MLATVTNKPSPVGRFRPPFIGPTTVQRLRSITSTVVDSQISRNNCCHKLYMSLIARIAHLSNTTPSMVNTVRRALI